MFLHVFLLCVFIIFILVTVSFVYALTLKNNSVADIAWGIGGVLIALTSLINGNLFSMRGLVISALILIWGLRLSWHIYTRNKGKSEDFRYKEWREKWGRHWKLKSYEYVFLLQGALMLVLALPVIFTNTHLGPSHGIFDRIGVLAWIVGFYFEAVGDYQLQEFKKKASNKNKILKSGLWKYTRHPNYFGESLMWWGVYIVALSNFTAWWTIISPIFITVSLLKVSGVTLLEKKYSGNREYKEYQKKTSTFIPWFPKS